MALSEHQRRSRRQERRTAAETGGKTTPGSGNTFVRGNDVVTGGWSIECKTTVAKGYRITLDALLAAERNALMDSREMVFQIEIQGRRYGLVTWDYLIELAGGEV
jgi:hypothetical protein